jgi:hypothetical protein
VIVMSFGPSASRSDCQSVPEATSCPAISMLAPSLADGVSVIVCVVRPTVSA